MASERRTQSCAFRIALWSGLSAGPVLSVLWPVFVWLESGVWPASMVALTLAMLTLGTIVGLAAAFTVLLPLLLALNLTPRRALPWTIAALSALVCVVLTTTFGMLAATERQGPQWPLALLLAVTGAACGGASVQIAAFQDRRNTPRK